MWRNLISKLSELKVRKQNQIKISKKSAALENLNDSEDINRTCKNIKQNVKTSAKDSLGPYELKQNKPWLDEEYLGFLDQRKQAKMQWLK
jgi:methylmalonyl-CoA mutase N-terminal domain/subunit